MNPDSVPILSIVIPYLYDAWLWFMFHRRGINIARKSYLVFGVSFLMQALLYVFFLLFDVPIEVRGFWARISFVSIALSFAIPLTFQYTQAK